MRSIRDLPIQRKLFILMLVVSTITALTTGIGTAVFEYYRYRCESIRDVSTQAEIVSAASAPAMVFQDKQTASEVLAALRVRPNITQACLYTPDGKPFAEYKTPPEHQLPAVRPTGNYADDDDIVFFQPVTLGGDVVGTLMLRSCLKEQQRVLRGNISIALGVIWLAMLVALLVARKLQRFTAAPILELARTAQDISAKKDYSLRAPVRSQDEVGTLAIGFNEMLLQIQKSDEATRASEERFRQLAENIHEVFWLTNLDKTEMLYVSPAYEHIWRRTCGSLYAAAMTWLDAIHPEDRDRVRQAAQTKQVLGTYDEEYRIICPDGSTRWIRDRAFPISDFDGAVYRLAGLAEDITERKRLQHQILEISDREQRRIGQDLHDGLSQHLTGTTMMAKALENELTEAKHPAAPKAAYIRDLLSQAVGQTRVLARGLSPVHLGLHGLIVALRELAKGVELQSGIRCTFDSTPFVSIEDNFVATHLYRVAQEAVNNALRHGKAQHITIALESNSDHGWMTITDDGVGISTRNRRSDGMGLHIMAERAQIIGGNLIVSDGPRGGTVVTCSFKQTPPHPEQESK